MEKNMIVIDENGNQIGRTFPKRANGLVKKGRAVLVDENTIRLYSSCPVLNCLEEDMIMNTIIFNTREWKKNTEIINGVVERSYMTVFDELKEVYTVGSADGELAEISTMMSVEPDTDYSFVFWMTGGDSEDFNEVAQLQVIFTDGDLTENELEEKNVYKLNRSFIKPVKNYKGWKMFCIPFTTTDKPFALLKFVAANTEVMLMKADVEVAEENDAADTADVISNITDVAKKVGNKAVELGNKAVETGKKYKEPAKELGEKGINGIKKGYDKLVNSDAFKKVEETINNIVAPKNKDTEENAEAEAETDVTEVTEAIETAEVKAEEAVAEAAEAAEEAAEPELFEGTTETTEE